MSDQCAEFTRYHVRRAAQERRNAEEAPSDMVRAIHANLASLHENMEAELESGARVRAGTDPFASGQPLTRLLRCDDI